MAGQTEISGRIEALVVIKHAGKTYFVTDCKTKGKINGQQKMMVTCKDENLHESKFKVTAEGLWDAMVGVVEAENETKCRQILVIDFDKGEWASYPIDEEMKRQLPFLRVERRPYVV